MLARGSAGTSPSGPWRRVRCRWLPCPNACLHARQCLAAITRFFAGDPDVLALIAAMARQYLGGADDPSTRLNGKRREAARKRLARAILRGQLDEFLP